MLLFPLFNTYFSEYQGIQQIPQTQLNMVSLQHCMKGAELIFWGSYYRLNAQESRSLVIPRSAWYVLLAPNVTKRCFYPLHPQTLAKPCYHDLSMCMAGPIKTGRVSFWGKWGRFVELRGGGIPWQLVLLLCRCLSHSPKVFPTPK